MLIKIRQAFQNPMVSFTIAMGLVIIAFCLFFVTEELFIPFFLIAPVIVCTLIVDYRVILYLLIFSLPLATTFRIEGINLNIGLPSEPLIGLLSLIAVIFIFIQDKKSGVLSHTMSKLIFLYWLTLVASFVFSTMPGVSFKTLLVFSCYLLVFFFLLTYFFLYNNLNIKKIYGLYALSFAGAVLFITWKHSEYAFNKSVSAVVVEPFFSDHTIYGACLAFMVPIAGVFYLKAGKIGLNYFQKILSGILLLVLLAAVYLSHSRATWISLGSVTVLILILQFRISFSTLMILMGIALVIALLNIEALMPVLIKNKYDSKAKRANLEEQIKSVTNIKNDVSNAERVNRWLCAVRMFKEKPLTGYGIGTYQFKYIPFQKGSEMTSISVTSAKNNYSQGKGGTAHSEYLLALAECGLLSGLLILTLALYSIYLGMKIYYKGNGVIKYYALMILLGLFTYFVHAIFNNFLTTDKAAFLVWGGMAALCALDLRYKKELTSTSSTI